MARIREFDKKEVIDRAMLIFWKQGYEATSIRDLKDAMGISSSSMYEVFGDKRGIFLLALARFCEFEREQISVIATEEPTPQRFIERLLTSVEYRELPEYRTQGSLAFNTMLEVGPEDVEITDLLINHYFSVVAIVSGVLAEGQSAGMITTQEPPDHLAYTILSTLQGMANIKGIKPDFAYIEDITRIVLKLLV
jgi:TetR/AcrR family transcriptional repressor of nem operon